MSENIKSKKYALYTHPLKDGRVLSILSFDERDLNNLLDSFIFWESWKIVATTIISKRIANVLEIPQSSLGNRLHKI